MSTFSAIFKDLTTFASKFEAEFAKLWAKAPQIDTVILTTLTFVAPLIETAVGLEAGAGAGNAVTAVLNTVEQDLIAAKGLVTAVGPTPSVTNLINGVANDLSALLTAGGVKNSTSISNITLVVKELEALAAAIPAPATPATVAA